MPFMWWDLGLWLPCCCFLDSSHFSVCTLSHTSCWQGRVVLW